MKHKITIRETERAVKEMRNMERGEIGIILTTPQRTHKGCHVLCTNRGITVLEDGDAYDSGKSSRNLNTVEILPAGTQVTLEIGKGA